MLQAGRLQVGGLIRAMNFVNLPNSSSRSMPIEFTQPLREMNTRNLSGG
jgi:hypothetical protein